MPSLRQPEKPDHPRRKRRQLQLCTTGRWDRRSILPIIVITTFIVLLNRILTRLPLPFSSWRMVLKLQPFSHDKTFMTNRNFFTNSTSATTTIAYAFSLIKCGDYQSNASAWIDAALVLRHSVHLQSRRNPSSKSKYDYHMYALIHSQAFNCSHVLRDAGFTLVDAPPPVQVSDIQGDYLRDHISTERCCGADEFIKLHAFLLPEPIVVHVDMDFILLQPMDDLFDALLYDASSPLGQAARARIPLEKKTTAADADAHVTMPREIQAFVTRDWPQVIPGGKPGFQAGFLVARTNPTVYHEVVALIHKGKYTKGSGEDFGGGWGDMGYGNYLGAMAMQGVMAYYYDVIRPNTAVELNQCRFNWMGINVKFESHPNFRPRHAKWGKCRNDGEYCEDCRLTPIDQIFNVHYTLCRKPWNCISVGFPGGRDPAHLETPAIDTRECNLGASLRMIRKWHELRSDLELQWYNLTRDELILQGRAATYKTDLFHGHCSGDGNSNYHAMQATLESLQQLPNLYR